jgi:hypothetical protein
VNGNEGGAAPREVCGVVCKSSNGSGKRIKVGSKIYEEITKSVIFEIWVILIKQIRLLVRYRGTVERTD